MSVKVSVTVIFSEAFTDCSQHSAYLSVKLSPCYTQSHRYLV